MNLRIFLAIGLASFSVACLTSGMKIHLTTATALEHLREIRAAETKFRDSSPTRRYATLDELLKESLVPKVLDDGVDYNYKFELATTDSGYTVHADAIDFDSSGGNFFMDETGIIRASLDRNTPPTDPTGQ